MRLLVLRFSSMGDVALLAPVLTTLASGHSNLSITLVTRKAYEPFFYNIPGVEVIGVNPDRDYRGFGCTVSSASWAPTAMVLMCTVACARAFSSFTSGSVGCDSQASSKADAKRRSKHAAKTKY